MRACYLCGVEMFAAAKLGVGPPGDRTYCSVFAGWCHQLELRLRGHSRSPFRPNCSNNTPQALPDWEEQCTAACYDCLLSYSNQPDHRYLDPTSSSVVSVMTLGMTSGRGRASEAGCEENASNRGDVGLHKHGSCAGRYTVPGHRPVYALPRGNGTYVIPGQRPTYITPRNGAYVVQSPGHRPVYALPRGNGTYVIPGQRPTYITPR